MVAKIKPGPQRGFSLFELAVVTTVISILAYFLLQRLEYTQEQAEKTAMEMTVLNVRTGLRYKMADMMFNNQHAQLETLLEVNPVQWLDKPPDNYAGELYGVMGVEIKPGSWYFDRQQQMLVYRLNRHAHYRGRDGIPEIRFRMRGNIQVVESNGVKWKVVSDIRLVQVDSVDWLKE